MGDAPCALLTPEELDVAVVGMLLLAFLQPELADTRLEALLGEASAWACGLELRRSNAWAAGSSLSPCGGPMARTMVICCLSRRCRLHPHSNFLKFASGAARRTHTNFLSLELLKGGPPL